MVWLCSDLCNQFSLSSSASAFSLADGAKFLYCFESFVCSSTSLILVGDHFPGSWYSWSVYQQRLGPEKIEARGFCLVVVSFLVWWWVLGGFFVSFFFVVLVFLSEWLNGVIEWSAEMGSHPEEIINHMTLSWSSCIKSCSVFLPKTVCFVLFKMICVLENNLTLKKEVMPSRPTVLGFVLKIFLQGYLGW